MRRSLILATAVLLLTSDLIIATASSPSPYDTRPGEAYSVSGRIVDADGVGLGEVTISFSGGRGSVTTAGDGTWSKIGLAGTVEVTPSKEGWTFGLVEATVKTGVAGSGSPAVHAGSPRTGGVVQIATGGSHCLALKSDGTVWAWGDNYAGNLGDGTDDDRGVPRQVVGLGGVIAVAAGYSHSLALKGDGTVWAWGSNYDWQLGDGTEVDAWTPQQVAGLDHITAIAAGEHHSLAVSVDGTVWAWGYGSKGQLGDGAEGKRSKPAQVAGLKGVVSVAAGYHHSLALKDDGTVWAWGSNHFGGDFSFRETIMPDGSVVWEDDSLRGQLGNGSECDSPIPVQVAGLDDVIIIAADFGHNLALKRDGTVWAWGDNEYGQMGDGTRDHKRTPVRVAGLHSVIAITSGQGFNLVVKADGTVWTWGDNSSGKLGDGTRGERWAPVQVLGLNGVVMLSSDGYHSLAVTGDGALWAWGSNYQGQLGDGTTADRYIPVRVLPLGLPSVDVHGATDDIVFTGTKHDYAAAGRVVDARGVGLGGVTIAFAGDHGPVTTANDGTWNVSGLVGTVTATPSREGWMFNPPGRQVNETATSLDFCALDASYTVSGRVTCSDDGQGLSGVRIGFSDGIGSVVTPSDGVWSRAGLVGAVTVTASKSGWAFEPVARHVTNARDAEPCSVVQVALGDYHSLAVRSDGAVWTWGDNSCGQLGDGTRANRSTPAKVNGLSGVVAVAAGRNHCLALKADGTVWAWGSNRYGQLGDGTHANRLTPSQVIELDGVMGISAGSCYSLALKADGTVWAWGVNDRGQQGDGTMVDRDRPVRVDGICEIVAINAGEAHCMALAADGTVWAWGSNYDGQLGDGTETQRSAPVQVSGLDGVVAIAAGSAMSMALKNDSTVWIWGSGPYVGFEGERRLMPIRVAELDGVVAIAAGWSSCLAIGLDGAVWGWGRILSDSGAGYTTVPTRVAGVNGAVAVYTSRGSHRMALMDDGTLRAWGSNYSGKLGDGTNTDRLEPVCVLSFIEPPIAEIDGVDFVGTR